MLPCPGYLYTLIGSHQQVLVHAWMYLKRVCNYYNVHVYARFMSGHACTCMYMCKTVIHSYHGLTKLPIMLEFTGIGNYQSPSINFISAVQIISHRTVCTCTCRKTHNVFRWRIDNYIVVYVISNTKLNKYMYVHVTQRMKCSRSSIYP